MDATEKLELVTRAWAEGCTVDFATATRVTRVSARNAASWERSGRPFARVRDGSFQIAEGRRYVCADFVAIKVHGK